MEKNSHRVFSTNPQAIKEETPDNPAPVKNPNQQTLRIMLDKKGRKGKSVTLIDGFSVNPQHLADIAKELKQFCGAGGTSKEGHIEIQGDHRGKVAEKLQKMGYKTKMAGG